MYIKSLKSTVVIKMSVIVSKISKMLSFKTSGTKGLDTLFCQPFKVDTVKLTDELHYWYIVTLSGIVQKVH